MIDLASLGVAAGTRALLSALLASAPASHAIDYSTTSTGTTQVLLAPCDPDRTEMVFCNPSDTPWLISTKRTLDTPNPFSGGASNKSGTYAPTLSAANNQGVLAVIAPGQSYTLSPAPRDDVYASCSAVGKALTATGIRLDRPSQRTIGISNPYGQPSLPNTQGVAQKTYADVHWIREDCDVFDLQPVFSGWFYQQGGSASETNNPSQFQIECEIEYPAFSGMKHRFTFDGANRGTVVPGYDKVSDALRGVIFKAGSPVRFITCVIVTNPTTDQIVFMRSATGPLASVCMQAGANLVGAIQAPTGAQNDGITYGPIAVLATAVQPNPKAVLLVVDSIGNGDNEATGVDDRNNVGWPARLLRKAGGGVPYVKIGRGGVAAYHIVGTETEDPIAATTRLRRLLSLLRYTHVIDQQGTNDCNQTNCWLSLGKVFALLGHKPYAKGTILPRTSSSDNKWSSTASQASLVPTVATSQKIRTLPQYSVLEASAPVSSSFDSGLWLPATPALTVEGVHPTGGAGGGADVVASDPALQAQLVAFLGRS